VEDIRLSYVPLELLLRRLQFFYQYEHVRELIAEIKGNESKASIVQDTSEPGGSTLDTQNIL
jgi:hypothetical protein